MIDEPDDKDKELMNLMQNYFPLSKRPFKDIAEKIGISEEEVISRLKKLSKLGLIRKIGAILSAKKIGFKSLLAAVTVPDDRVDETARVINKYSSVTHNYLREGTPNIWFTLTEPNQESLNHHISEIENKINTKIIRMPAQKVYKIGVKFDIQ